MIKLRNRDRLFLIAVFLPAWAWFAPSAVPAGSWATQTSGTSNFLNCVNFPDASNGWATASYATLLHTTNGGDAWFPVTSHGVPSGSTNGFNSVGFLDLNNGWIGGVWAVYRTTDGGATWQGRQYSGSPARNHLCPITPDQAWAVGPSSTSLYFLRYDFSGTTMTETSWTLTSAPSFYAYDLAFPNANTGWTVGAKGLIVRIASATTSAPTFTLQTSNTTEDLNAIFMLDANTGWAVGTKGICLSTTNGGDTWTAVNTGVTTTLHDVFFLDGNTGWVVGDGGLILATGDGGGHWTPESSGVSAELRSITFTGGIGYCVGKNGTILKRTPGQKLYFPRLSFVPGAWDEGFGFVNRGDAAAAVNFAAYGQTGNQVKTAGPVGWPAHTQGAYQADGLFSLAAPLDAWVEATSDQTSMLGFFLTEHFSGGLTGLDGAEAFTSLTTEGVLPTVKCTGGFSSEVMIANPGNSETQVAIKGYDGTGAHDGGVVAIPPHGFVKADVASLCGAAFDGFLHLKGTRGFIANAVLKYGDAALSSINVQPAVFTSDYTVNGTWTGTTSQGKALSLVVENNAVKTVGIGVAITACGLESSMTTTFSPPQAIVNNQFAVTVGGPLSYTLNGTFSSATAAGGTVNFTYNQPTYPFCSGTASATWTAVKSATEYRAEPVGDDGSLSAGPLPDNPGEHFARSFPQATAPLYAPHIVLFPDLYFTEVNLINPQNKAITATLSPYKYDGTPLASPFPVTIPGWQLVTLRDTQLGLPPGAYTDGWLKVESGTDAVLGCLTFGNPTDNHYLSTLPLLSTPAQEQYFCQVANGNIGGIDYFTGLAVVNPAASAGDATIRVFGSDGTLFGATTRSLAAGEKYVRLIQQIEGIGALPSQASGYIQVSSTVPMFAFVLFGNGPLDFLSAVPAQR